jgi:hypothetical protein
VRLWRFQHNLNDGLEFLLARKDQMLAPALWILLDWVLTIAILWSAFRSVNYPIAFGLVVIGFAVGICLSLVSLVRWARRDGRRDDGGVRQPVGSARARAGRGPDLPDRVLRPAALMSLFFFHGLMLKVAHGVASGSRSPQFDTSLPPSI